MKSWHIDKFGDFDGLALREATEKRPGLREILVRVRATSLNYRDIAILKAMYRGRPLKPGLVPVSDGAGEVVAVGEGVHRFQVGDRVAGIFRQDWYGGKLPEAPADFDLGGGVDGMLSEYVVLSEEGAVALPDHLSFEEAATLPCAGLTAWTALTGWESVVAGETVLVLGSGGVSVFALQFARMFGARVIATSSSDAKLERYRAMGADGTVNYKSTPEWQAEVLKLTQGRGVDRVVEIGGPGTLDKSFQSARVGGRVSIIGTLGGPARIDPAPIMGRRLSVQGISVGSREGFEAMNRAVALHKLQPVIDRVFPFAEAPDAFRYLASGQHFGKVVIKHG